MLTGEPCLRCDRPLEAGPSRLCDGCRKRLLELVRRIPAEGLRKRDIALVSAIILAALVALSFLAAWLDARW